MSERLRPKRSTAPARGGTMTAASGSLGNCLVDPVLIVSAVGGEGGKGIGDLVEQRINHLGVVDILAAQTRPRRFWPVPASTPM